ncbi:MAG TPA: hypothetical protein VGH32_04925 [Pirellulales bacterium]
MNHDDDESLDTENARVKLATMRQMVVDLTKRVDMHAGQIQALQRSPYVISSALVASMSIAGGILAYAVLPPINHALTELKSDLTEHQKETAANGEKMRSLDEAIKILTKALTERVQPK